MVGLMRIRQGLRRGTGRVFRSTGRGRRGQDRRVTRVAFGIRFHRGARRIAAFRQRTAHLRWN